MRTMNSLAVLAAGALALSWSSPARAYEADQDVGVDVQHNVRGPNYGSKQAKFDEYHPMVNGVIIDHYSLDLDTADYELKIRAKNVDQLDQEYQLEGGKPGAFSWSASWNQTPHILSENARTLYSLSGNTLVMNPSYRGAAGATAGAAFAAYVASITTALNGNGVNVPLQIQQESADIGLTFHPWRDWTASFSGDRTHKYGNKPMGGSFGFSNVIEVPQPVDHEIYGASADFGVAKKAYQANFHYELSTFHNNYNDLIWDSPQSRVFLNGTSAQGRMALEPDNQAHNFALSGGADLPGKTHVSAEFGVELLRQNGSLDPFSVNPAALTAAQQAAGLGLTPANADRRINVYTQSYRLSNSSLDWFRTSLAYRGFLSDNRSSGIVFPGYVPYDGKFNAGYYPTQQPSQTKNALDWKGDFDLTKDLGLATGYTYEYDKQSGRIIPTYYEQRFQAGFNYTPVPGFFANISYLAALRRMKDYDPTPFFDQGAWSGTPGLIQFDVGDRNRSQGRLQLQYSHGDTSYGLSYRNTQDAYRPGTVPLDGSETALPLAQFKQYGLLSHNNQAGGLNVSQQLGDNWDADFYYELEYTRMIIASNHPPGVVITQSPQTDWTQRYIEKSNIGGLALNFSPRHDLKLTGSYDVVATNGHLDFLYFNPTQTLNGVGPGLNSPSPIIRLTQIVGLKAKHQTTKTLSLSARYQYYKYNVQDYAVNQIPLIIPAGTNIYLGNSQSSFYAHTWALGADYRF